MKQVMLASLLVAAGISLHFSSTASGQTSYTIEPGQEAIVSFHFNGSTTPYGIAPDLFAFGAGGHTVASLSSTTASLFDGNNLLGSETQTGMFSFFEQAFKSANNTFPEYVGAPSVTIDFTSMLQGTIQGQLVLEPTFTNPGPGDDLIVTYFDFQLLNQIAANSGNALVTPVIDSFQIVPIPEPIAPVLILLGSPLLAAAGLQRRQDV